MKADIMHSSSTTERLAASTRSVCCLRVKFGRFKVDSIVDSFTDVCTPGFFGIYLPVTIVQSPSCRIITSDGPVECIRRVQLARCYSGAPLFVDTYFGISSQFRSMAGVLSNVWCVLHINSMEFLDVIDVISHWAEMLSMQ